MIIENIKINNQRHKVLIADEGKVIKRIGVNEYFGNKLTLGYSYYINGQKLDKPYKDKPEDFEEIEITNNI